MKLREHSGLDVEPSCVHEPDDRSHGLRCEVIRQVDSAIDLKVVIKIYLAYLQVLQTEKSNESFSVLF